MEHEISIIKYVMCSFRNKKFLYTNALYTAGQRSQEPGGSASTGGCFWQKLGLINPRSIDHVFSQDLFFQKFHVSLSVTFFQQLCWQTNEPTETETEA